MTASDHTVEEGTLGQRSWAIDGLAIILRPPRGGVDINMIGIEAESSGLDSVIDNAIKYRSCMCQCPMKRSGMTS